MYRPDDGGNDYEFSVAQIGSYLATCGGVQVHISRLHKMLKKSGISSKIYCPYKTKSELCDDVRIVRNPWWARSHLYYWGYHWFLQYGLKCDESIIHCHEQWKMAISMVGLLLRNKKIVMTIHDQMLEYRWKTILHVDRVASKFLIRSNNVWWIAVSDAVKMQLQSIGVLSDRISVIPAFIPPESTDMPKSNLPALVQKFIDDHAPVISTYGWMLAIDSNGCDLHSFDHCIELIKELKQEFPKIGLVICLPTVSDGAYFDVLQARIQQYGLTSNIMMLTEPLKEGYLLWKHSDVYLRATTTDGDSLSIREALSVGVPVIASDASSRPEGAIVFKTRNLFDMIQAVRAVLVDQNFYTSTINKFNQIDTYGEILKLYQHVYEYKI